MGILPCWFAKVDAIFLYGDLYTVAENIEIWNELHN